MINEGAFLDLGCTLRQNSDGRPRDARFEIILMVLLDPRQTQSFAWPIVRGI